MCIPQVSLQIDHEVRKWTQLVYYYLYKVSEQYGFRIQQRQSCTKLYELNVKLMFSEYVILTSPRFFITFCIK